MLSRLTGSKLGPRPRKRLSYIWTAAPLIVGLIGVLALSHYLTRIMERTQPPAPRPTGPAAASQLPSQLPNRGTDQALAQPQPDGEQLKGIVTDALGRPVQQAVIQVADAPQGRPAGGIWRGAATSAADGSFSISAPEKYRAIYLTAYHPGFAPGWTGPIAVVPGERPPTAAITLTSGGTVEGVVRDISGNLVPDAVVFLSQWIAPVDRTSDLALTTHAIPPESAPVTDAEGAFKLARIAPGRCAISVAHPGYYLPEDRLLTINEGQVIGDLVLTVVPQLSISGRAMEADGAPIAILQITAQSEVPGAGQAGRVIYQKDGSFEISGLSAGDYKVSVYAAAPGDHGESRVETRHEVPAGSANLKFIFHRDHKPSGTVRGRAIRRANGQPVTAFAVHLQPVADPDNAATPKINRMFLRTRHSTFASAAGVFAIDGIAPGRYIIAVEAEGLLPVLAGPVDVAEGSDLDAGTVEMADGGLFRGRIDAADTASPLAGATVRLKPQQREELSRPAAIGFGSFTRQTTGDDGRFSFANAAPGSYTLSVNHRIYSDGEALIEMPPTGIADEIIIALKPRGAITGRVVADATGEPVGGALLIVFAADERRQRLGNAASSAGTTREDGEFSLVQVPAGEQLLTVNHPEYAEKIIDHLPIPAGESLAGLEIRLSRGGQICGKVSGETGEPAAGMTVMILSDSPTVTVQTDSNGVYIAEHLAPAGYNVQFGLTPRARIEFGTMITAKCWVSEGTTTTVDLDLSAFPGIRGQVTRGGQPVSDLTIWLHRNTESDAQEPHVWRGQATSDAWGQYNIPGLPPGNYSVSYYDYRQNSAAPLPLAIDLGPSGWTQDIRLPE